jgi:hypothetical protein
LKGDANETGARGSFVIINSTTFWEKHKGYYGLSTREKRRERLCSTGMQPRLSRSNGIRYDRASLLPPMPEMPNCRDMQ